METRYCLKFSSGFLLIEFCSGFMVFLIFATAILMLQGTLVFMQHDIWNRTAALRISTNAVEFKLNSVTYDYIHNSSKDVVGNQKICWQQYWVPFEIRLSDVTAEILNRESCFYRDRDLCSKVEVTWNSLKKKQRGFSILRGG